MTSRCPYNPGGSRPALAFDAGRLASEVLARCDLLACCTEEAGRTTRLFLGTPMHAVHERLGAWMQAAGMEVRLDAIGNLIGHYPAECIDCPTFLIGSHVDTVPNAGKYDGVLGVLLGVTAVQALHGQRLPFAVEVVAFSEEEGVRYRTSYLGSRALAGRFDPTLLDLTDTAGVSMADAIRGFGLDPARISEASYRNKRLAGYLEAHIEQGPVLEALDRSLGVVETIVGQSRLDLTFLGKAGHAGCLPMELRQDALAAAAEFILAVEELAGSCEGLRATVGRIAVTPGASNVVPASATLSLDIRHGQDTVREQALAALLAQAKAAAARRGVRVRIDHAEQHPSVPMDARLTDRLAERVRSFGIEPVRMVSGAGHDAAMMAGLTPAAMLFLRSIGGISHHPDEAVRAADVAFALQVMVGLLHDLAQEMA